MEQLPTKRNLLMAKRNLLLANQGHNLLDKKHAVLVRELSYVKATAKQLKCQFENTLQGAKILIKVAKAEIGAKSLEKIVEKLPFDTSLHVSFKNIMGAVIPQIKSNEIGHNFIFTSLYSPAYSLYESTASLDEAFFAWQNVKNLLIQLAESETALRRINIQLQKAKKRAAALKNITIPKYEAHIKYITNQLEERERDELARIKTCITHSQTHT